MKKLLYIAALAALTGCTSFTVSSFNIRCPFDKGDNHWTLRVPRIVKVVKDHGFDIFGVQEAVSTVADRIQAELPGFSRIGCGREFNCTGESNYIFYDSKRFECLDYGTFWLSETPLVAGSRYKGAGCPRTCTWGVFKDLRTGRKFRFFNTHLDHISSQARIDGVRVIIENGLADAIAKGETVLLTGDMNETLANPDSPEALKTVVGDVLQEAAKTNPIALLSTQLNDTYAMSETPHKGTHKTFQGFKPDFRFRIDYVYATDDVRVLSHATINDRPGGKYPSDHDAVAAVVELK